MKHKFTTGLVMGSLVGAAALAATMPKMHDMQRTGKRMIKRAMRKMPNF
ncbi:MAG: hypothetical protein ACOYJA_11270 [Christensenellales bacterium]|jgi:hypothetical protein